MFIFRFGMLIQRSFFAKTFSRNKLLYANINIYIYIDIFVRYKLNYIQLYPFMIAYEYTPSMGKANMPKSFLLNYGNSGKHTYRTVLPQGHKPLSCYISIRYAYID